MSEARDNSGILFKNDRKERDAHPDYTGRATIDGVEYFFDAWIKQGAKGKFMSCAFKPKDQQRAAPAKAAPQRQEMDEEIPF